MKKIISVLVAIATLAPVAAFAADTTSPDITLFGNTVMSVAQGTYVEPGYSAIDDTDGDITGNVSVTGLDSSIGTHTLSYNVSDAAGNAAATQVRSVSFYGNGLASPCIVNGTCPCPIDASPITGDRAAWKACAMMRYPKLEDGSTLVCRLTPVAIGEAPQCAKEQGGFWNMVISPSGEETYR